ncbi:MAG: T9SS type A sorting domain-containing protein [Bacteroidales bacterium]|nr:T9SS type A sorting domain-containing protein [Bacteroidales bacterium]
MRTFLLKIKFYCFVVLIGLTQQAMAQDCGVLLRHLDVNPVLINATNRDELRRAPSSVESERQPLLLPFLDDFSSLHSPFPNDSLWEDNMVFINASFPLFPPTIGVATFDALDATGRLYEHAASYPFGADTLTSRPIRLDSIFDGIPREITDADSIFFSFYFQPGGGFGTVQGGNIRGHAPRPHDELVLEFRNDTGRWDVVWHANGQTLEQFCWLCIRDTAVVLTRVIDTITVPGSLTITVHDTISLYNRTIRDTTIFTRLGTDTIRTAITADTIFIRDVEKEFFRQVSIRVDTAYFYNGFQFRFRNISSLDQDHQQNQSRQSSGGQWHIDYVRLDAYPNGFNRFSSDIAFVHQGERVLRDFQAMPANQFQTSDLVSEIPILFRNLDSEWRGIHYNFQITGPSPSYFSWTASPSSTDVQPFSTHGFNSSPGIDIYYFQRDFPSFFPNEPDSGVFFFQHVLTLRDGQEDLVPSNNTMIQTVHFGNYFAYDDGTPEAGFGFFRQADRPVSQFAYRFPMRVPDSLVAIQIWFNDAPSDMSRAFFNLVVWTAADINGMPLRDSTILIRENLLPDQGDTIGFFTYWLDTPLPLNSGDFFIGFEQRNNFFLNIGFDLNNNASGRMFSRFDAGEWATIFAYGSVMMRPVFGTSESIPPSTSILDRDDPVDVSQNIRIFPNPSDGVVFVESPENVVNSYEIFDLSGRRLLQRTVNNTQFSVDLPQNSGFYILILHTESGIIPKRVVRR